MKPELKKCHERAMDLLYFLEHTNFNHTKKTICEMVFGWDYNNSNERRTREVVSYLASLKPIIAVSDNTGYRLAKSILDANDIIHQLNELQSRIDELEKRKKPLHKIYKKLKLNSITN